jgi:hypothetical protein
LLRVCTLKHTRGEKMKQETINETKFKIISTEKAQQAHENILKGHWFDKESQRFFKSRWSDRAYLVEELNTAFFISSEQHESYYPEYHKEARKYTIRAVNMKTGHFVNETIWTKDGAFYIVELEFQGFYTSREAKKCLLNTNWLKYKKALGVYNDL